MPRLEQGLAGRPFEVCVLPGGEEQKTLGNVAVIIDALVAGRLNRDGMVLALGGGVIGDIAGFAAASYQRGIAIVQLPTTLLAQVDSSVGGKTGVNHPGGKNLIGAFHQPTAVIADTDVLTTLPDRQLRAGLTEIVKAALVADASFFAWLEANLSRLLAKEPAALSEAILRACAIKAAIVAEDEREHGPARAPEPRPHLWPRHRGGGRLRPRAARRGRRRGPRARCRALCAPGTAARRRCGARARAARRSRPARRPAAARRRAHARTHGDGQEGEGWRDPAGAARGTRTRGASPTTIRAERSRRCWRSGQAHEAWPRSGRRARALGGPGAQFARAAPSRAAGRLAQRVPARPRPHHPLERLPAPGLQDAGVHQPRRRHVPHAAHPLDRGGADRPLGGRGALALRAADRGDLPRA